MIRISRHNLERVTLASLLQIPADLLLDCRCCYYKVADGYMISWGIEWRNELSEYNEDLKKSPYFVKQIIVHNSIDTLFKKPLTD